VANEKEDSMKLIPILFSTEMVQAILEGRKTQTRREVKPQPTGFIDDPHFDILIPHKGKLVKGTPLAEQKGSFSPSIKCPYGWPGDVLWVRESFLKLNKNNFSSGRGCLYKADVHDSKATMYKWRPSIHMPKTACRIWLKVKAVRVERLLEISNDDSISEGISLQSSGYYCWNPDISLSKSSAVPINAFKTLWQSINGPESWEANPWVWVISFERCEMPSNFFTSTK
jgi:hypothetical protein